MLKSLLGLSARVGAASKAIETLEPRTLMSLVGVAPLTDLPLTFYNNTGELSYDSASDVIAVAATPTAILTATGPKFISSTHGGITLDFRVGAGGQLLGGGSGHDLILQGEVDLDDSGTIDPGESGVLLTGEIAAFGHADSGGPTDQYDARFVVTGGSLAGMFAGKDIGLLLTSEQSTFSGTFGADFTGGAKGVLGPTNPPDAASISGFVYVDRNNNGEINLGDDGIAGVTVTLTGTNEAGQPVSLTTTTDADGAYSFPNLRPGSYVITEGATPGYADGLDSIGSQGGVTGNDVLTSITLGAGVHGVNNNFGEILSGGSLGSGMTATIGFWHNKNGQALLKSLNGGPTSTALGDYLADNYPNMYGASAGANNLAGKTNAQVAAAFIERFSVKGQKLDAQVMAVAFATYVTSTDLSGGNFAGGYGFTTSAGGIGGVLINVGTNGAAFGVPNGTVLTVAQLLSATNSLAVNGVLYNNVTALRNMANTIYDYINTRGDI